MSLTLREQLYWCDCAGRAVFLDARAGRYFCLAGATNDAFLRLASGPMETGDCDLLSKLIDRGLLVTDSDGASMISKFVSRPAFADLPAIRASRPSLILLLRALAAELRAGRQVRKLPFIQILEDAAAAGPARVCPPADLEACAQGIAAAAASLAFFTGATDRCLVRALAVFSACRRSGLRPSLVFGVRIDPFAAHSWVQIGGDVVVGEYEKVRLYTPILVLE
jgi:hypothetical protein